MKRITALIVCAVFLQSCHEHQDAQSLIVKEKPAEKNSAPAFGGPSKLADQNKPGGDVRLITGEWTLVAIDEQILTSGGTPTLVFEEDGSCWGSTGVNKFRSNADIKKIANGLLELGPAAVTRMAGPPEAMALERMFLERLSATSSFSIEGDTLHLYAGERGAVTFERVKR
jgi:heat shock protein HslJ